MGLLMTVDQSTPASKIIPDLLHASGIDLVASLPDTWVVNLIDQIKDDQRFEHVHVSREEAAIGIASGAFLSGRNAAAVMGTSGFVASIYAITKINFTYEIGFPIVMNLRGQVGDKATHHVGNGMLMLPMFQTLGIPYEILRTVDDLERIPDLIHHARLMKRPVAICLDKTLRD
jgi:sulfopyruvate decarboxylase subunit alpha